MIWTALLPLCFAYQRPISTSPQPVGWSDEMNRPNAWSSLKNGNDAKVSAPIFGALKLSLGPVPKDWPYEYQWSGVSRRVRVDIGRYPFLTAHVAELSGYAHMDIDVLDATGKAVKGFRSSTIEASGTTFVNLEGQLDPAVYELRIKLIVGGPNSGCFATYNWLSFSSVEAGTVLKDFPETKRILKKH